MTVAINDETMNVSTFCFSIVGITTRVSVDYCLLVVHKARNYTQSFLKHGDFNNAHSDCIRLGNNAQLGSHFPPRREAAVEIRLMFDILRRPD
jgi:hypothetical protein